MKSNKLQKLKEMFPNTYKTYLKLKKEKIMKFGLWISGIVLTISWLSILIATSIDAGNYRLLSNETISVDGKNLAMIEKYLLDFNHYQLVTIEQDLFVFKAIVKVGNNNPLFLVNQTGWYMLVLLAPVGYLGIIFTVAFFKNMVTPESIKRTVRRALQFGYLKQDDVDFVVREIDYNTGRTIRPLVVKINVKDVKKNKKNIS